MPRTGIRGGATEQERVEYRRLYYLAFPDKRRELERRKLEAKPEYYRKCRQDWRADNREHLLKGKKKWYEQNKEWILPRQKILRKLNPEKTREIQRKCLNKKRRTNIRFKILCNLRRRLHWAIKGQSKSARTVELLGCSIESFIVYLESKFQTGMTFDNYGSSWHVDHIMPCAIFDLSRPEHQRACFHFSNLQPLWKEDNMKKGKTVLTNQLNLL